MTKKAEKVEKVKVSLPVEVNVRLSEDVIDDALRKSELFWVKIKPRMDLGKLIESFVKDPKAFYLDFYGKSPPETFQDLVKLIEKHLSTE